MMDRFRKILCDSTTRGAPAYSPTSDALGLFPGEGEDEAKFAERVDFLNRELEMLEDGSSDLRDWIGSSPEVPENLRKQAGELTWKRFRFRAEWVPAWFSSRRTGCFSAGVLLEVDHRLPLVFLHSAFLRKSRRMGYDAAETLAHEMVHAVRIAFPGSAYEEFFPCQVHRSGFRRVFGNLFRRWWIPVLFFGGLAALPVLAAAGIPGFWWPILLPVSVTVREVVLLRRIGRAAENLRKAGVEALPVLLRLSDREIFEIAALAPDEIPPGKDRFVRWKTLLETFRRNREN